MKKDQAIESEFQPPKCPFVCTADEIKPYEEMKVSLVCNRHNNKYYLLKIVCWKYKFWKSENITQ